MKRTDIRTKVRDLLYEATADLFSDDRINRAIDDQLRNMPSDEIYNEVIERTPVVSTQLDYSLPSLTEKLEKLEIVIGSGDNERFREIKGWDTYAGAVWLPYRITSSDTLRMHIAKRFTDLTDDVTDTDVPNNKIEILVVGAAIRCYNMLIGYFVHTNNWDTIGKPDGTDMTKIIGWINELKQTYSGLLKVHRKSPKPRDIDLVS